MPRRLLLESSLLVLPALSPGAADAASFILRDGEVVDGRLVTATRNTLTVVRDIGGIRQLPINALEQVRVETPRGTSRVRSAGPTASAS